MENNDEPLDRLEIFPIGFIPNKLGMQKASSADIDVIGFPR